MVSLLQVSKHMKQSSMHWTHTFVNPFGINRLIAELEVVGESIISNTICLNFTPNPFELPAASLVLTLALYTASLLVD